MQRERPVSFTVVALTKVKVLQITKEDFFSTIPKEYILALKSIVEERKMY